MPKKSDKIRNLYKNKAYKEAPLTSEIQLENEVAKRNALNKQRAKAMERRVARYLKGSRIPMSGAMAQYKGDVTIPFVNNPGGYLIECKLSAQAPKGIPQIRLFYSWFPKIHSEAKSMPMMKFGIVIIHYHQKSDDYVFIRRDIVEKLITKYESVFAKELAVLLDASLLDCSLSNKSFAATYNLRKRLLDTRMIEANGLKGMRILLPDSEYLVMYISGFRTVMEGV